MRVSRHLLSPRTSSVQSSYSPPPIIQITNSTFYRQYPSSLGRDGKDGKDGQSNPALFPNLSFSLPSFPIKPHHWCILGSSSSGKTTLLEILRGQHLNFPPTSRSFPYLSTDGVSAKDKRLRSPIHALQYVDFSGQCGGLGGFGTRGAYLSARYESRREETDISVIDYLRGFTGLNPLKAQEGNQLDDKFLDRVITDLKLQELVTIPVGNLSNGQKRRAKIARALLVKPEVLLLDEPFLGLDPSTIIALSPLLQRLALSNSPRLVLSLCSHDPIPHWITHLMYLHPDCKVACQGTKQQVLTKVRSAALKSRSSSLNLSIHSMHAFGRTLTPDGIFQDKLDEGPSSWLDSPDLDILGNQEKLVEMEGVQISYGGKTVLGDWEETLNNERKQGLWWTVRRGDRWGIFGPNGSGKTTILSLSCSDHPQTYALPIRLFGQLRLPRPGQPGISIFEIQSRIGHSSPEIHAFFPRNLTVRQTLENAWADTFLGKPQLSHEQDCRVDACLRWFEAELNPSSRPSPARVSEGTRIKNPSLGALPNVDHKGRKVIKTRKRIGLELKSREIDPTDLNWADLQRFGELPLASQKVALFLRTIIKQPDLVILDEAFSGMGDHVRDKCMLFLIYGETRFLHYIKKRGPLKGEFQLFKKVIQSKQKRVNIAGLNQEQALICVSHVLEEVPSLIKQWLCLPEPNEGKAPRYGRTTSFSARDWREIWGVKA